MKSKSGSAALVNKKDQKARATLVMMERLHGKSLVELATEFNCNVSTITRDLELARTNNLVIAKAHTVILQRLLPKVLAVYDAHLEDGNLDAARDILHFFERTQSQGSHSAATDGVETLELFRERYFRKTLPAADPVIATAALPGVVITDAPPVGPPRTEPPSRPRAVENELQGTDEEL